MQQTSQATETKTCSCGRTGSARLFEGDKCLPCHRKTSRAKTEAEVRKHYADNFPR